MFLVDSDYDTEDEEYGDDIEEIITGQIGNSVPSDDEHDDLCAQVRALPNSPKKMSGSIQNPFKRNAHQRKLLNDSNSPSQISERRNKKRKELAAKLFDEDIPNKNQQK